MRCNYQGSLPEHAQDAGHPLCICCARSLHLAEKQTCTVCTGRTRADLADVENLYMLLPDELGNLHTPALDQSRAPGYDPPMPGGEPLALLGPGSKGATQILGVPVPGGRDDSHSFDEYPDDPQSVVHELTRWEDDWRLTRGEPAATGPASVSTSRRYLNARLTWAADYHPAFDEFASDMQSLRSRLARVTSTDDIPVRGVPCFDCDAHLQRVWTSRGLAEEWTCPRCDRRYTHAEHGMALAARLRAEAAPDAVLELRAIHTLLSRRYPGIRLGTLRVWATRGRIKPVRQGSRGQSVYRVGDVEDLLSGKGVDQLA